MIPLYRILRTTATIGTVGLAAVLGRHLYQQYHRDIRAAYAAFEDADTDRVETAVGTVEYKTTETSVPVLVAHGIFGWFDQALQTGEGVLDAADAVTDGESQPAVVSFATVGELRKLLTDRRVGLLQALTDTDGAAESISALADDLGRDYRSVHDDVSLLADDGLVFIIEDGQAKRPYLPYERIHLDVDLVSSTSEV